MYRLQGQNKYHLLSIQKFLCYKFIKKEIPVNISNWYFIFPNIYRIIYRIYFICIDYIGFADSYKETFWSELLSKELSSFCNPKQKYKQFIELIQNALTDLKF